MISVTILTKNSERHLDKVLEALQAFDEVVIYDTGSTDQTLCIARQYGNVKVYEGPFEGFGPTHNCASEKASHDWILSIDSDEIVSEELVKEIRSLQLEDRCVYSIWRKNLFNGKWIRWCGWYPDRVKRLYNRRSTSYNGAQVHESVITTGMQTISLKHPLIHYPYEDISDFLHKMQHYSHLFAKEHAGKKKSSLSRALIHGACAFFKSYIIKRGFMGGREGWVISLYNAHCAYYKYLKLWHENLVRAHGTSRIHLSDDN